jgi:hypothetical protein
MRRIAGAAILICWLLWCRKWRWRRRFRSTPIQQLPNGQVAPSTLLEELIAAAIRLPLAAALGRRRAASAA